MTESTEVAHTPGPWAYDFGPEPGHASEFLVLGPRNSVLAYVGADEARDVLGPTVEANARLMSAGPELLEALKAFVRIGKFAGVREWGKAQNQAIAVIDKAEGRS